jgi:putative membrane protein
MSQRWIRIILFILYLVGAFGMLIPETRNWFLKLSALNLLLSFIALILSRKENTFRFIGFLAIAFMIGFGAELIGVHTAYLFGSYQYGANLGMKWAGVPIIIGLNWGILTVTSSAVIQRFGLNSFLSALLSAILMVLFDYILEPVAIKLDYWHWTDGQIPLYNFICWFGVSFILQWVYRMMKLSEVNKVAESLFLMMFIFFTLLTI